MPTYRQLTESFESMVTRTNDAEAKAVKTARSLLSAVQRTLEAPADRVQFAKEIGDGFCPVNDASDSLFFNRESGQFGFAFGVILQAMGKQLIRVFHVKFKPYGDDTLLEFDGGTFDEEAFCAEVVKRMLAENAEGHCRMDYPVRIIR